MINVRNRLLKIDSRRKNCANVPKIKKLSVKIIAFFTSAKRGRVRRAATGGNSNLWKAVKIAKCLNMNAIPNDLTLGGLPVATGQAASIFAGYFSSKVNENVRKTVIDPINVYNGKCKLIVQNRNFMTVNDVNDCLLNLNSKKCEGFDRIPVCAVYDAPKPLLEPLSLLFHKIYHTCTIHEQWKVSKIIPVFKKGS